MSDTTTKLLTLLNVSAVKGVRGSKRVSELDGVREEKRVKLNRRKVEEEKEEDIPDADEEDKEVDGEDIEEDVPSSSDPFAKHFGPQPEHLTEQARKEVDEKQWKQLPKRSLKETNSTLLEFVPSSLKGEEVTVDGNGILPRLFPAFEARQKELPPDLRSLQSNILSTLSTSRDLYLTKVQIRQHAAIRDALSLYVLNHIMKIRKIVLKNNAKLSSAPSEDPIYQDQGFTRPSILLLLPFRNSAFPFLSSFLSLFSSLSPTAQIHHHARFLSLFSLPSGSEDKLETAPLGTYPPDHIEMFKGNIDDEFRLGVKVTKKSVRLFEGFYGSDLILASPVGLKIACEKEGNADFLSSIEVVVVDQLDAMTMQNWEHLQYVFAQLNQIPKQSHNTDFSRIKPWYLDSFAPYVRQTILLSPYETPDTRALFSSLKNVSGKVRTVERWSGEKVREGISQEWIKFDAGNGIEEVDRRFEHFTTKLFPDTLKSAVQSSQTLLFIPSYFDFVRVQNWLKKSSGVGDACAFISEYSSNADISRARQAFFTGKKQFLIITERFHFFRRYKIRGILNLLFYAPPDHAQFYSELISFPFLDEEKVKEEDVSVKVLYSRYDWMRIERIVGNKGVKGVMKE